MPRVKKPSIPAKILAQSITSTATSFKLNNILDWNGVALTSSAFGDYAWGTFRNATNTQVEYFRFDPSTIASASITIVKRGLDYLGADYDSEITLNKYSWSANETIVELGTNPPGFYDQFPAKYNAETIGAVWTFGNTTRPKLDSDVDATADTEFITQGQLNRAALGTTLTDRIIVGGTAGETVAAGNIVYYKASDGRWWKASAATAATCEGVQLGVAQGAGTAGNGITGGVLKKGLDTNRTGLTLGAPQYLSDTAGAVSATTGTLTVSLGNAKSTTEMYFNPRFLEMPLGGQKAALAGSSGTPSASNKYLTEADKTGSNLPVGSIISYSLASAPTGFLLCDGSAVSRTTYATLFGVIATTFGVGDGSTTFNVPNLLGKVIVGIKTASKTVIEDCEDAWNELVDADVTSSLDTVDFKLGSGSAKFVVAAGASAGDILATEVIAPSATVFHGKTHVTMWIKSTVALSAGDLQLLLDNTGSCASPLESLNVPAVIANTWTRVYMPLADPGLLASVISIGIKMVVDKGAFTLNIDDIAIGEAMELGDQGGYESYSTSIGEMPSHTHPGTNLYVSNGAAAGFTGPVYGDSSGQTTGAVPTQGGDLAHPNMQPYLAMSYIIKT